MRSWVVGVLMASAACATAPKPAPASAPTASTAARSSTAAPSEASGDDPISDADVVPLDGTAPAGKTTVQPVHVDPFATPGQKPVARKGKLGNDPISKEPSRECREHPERCGTKDTLK